jgi:shikimate dehydrogenase
MSTAATRLFALLGDPVHHSLSPVMHEAAMRRAGIDAAYVALRCTTEDVPGLLLGLAYAGGGGNVTIPHKGVAACTVDAPSARVRATRACNTFWLYRKRVHGENTDVPAFAAALKRVVPDLRGTRVLILGAGGAARAAIFSLLEQHSAAITVLARSAARAREIEQVAGRSTKRVTFTTSLPGIRDEGFDVVVNATPLGLRASDPLPLQLHRIAAVTAVFDMVYKAGGTRWTNYARSLGVPAAEGSEMLILQAAAAFELWFGVDAPVDMMRRAFLRASQFQEPGDG